MRILFSTMPFLGHFFPLVPLARALGRRHEVAVASGGAFAAEIARAGLRSLSAGFDAAEALVELARRRPADPIETLERQRRVLATEIAVPRMVDDLVQRIHSWRPALLIHEEGELAAPIAARRTGIPCVTHGWPAPMMGAERAHRLRNALATVRPPSPGGTSPFSDLHGDLFLDCCPASLNPQAEVHPAQRHLVRPELYDGSGAIPQWLHEFADDAASAPRTRRRRPAVYVTLGTVPAFSRPADLSAILRALQNEPLDLIATVGPDNDPSALGTFPPNVRVERYIPQSRLLPLVDAVVAHGGAGTSVAALAHGLPLLLLPRSAASQERMAAASASAGAAIVCNEIHPSCLREAMRTLLERPSYRQASARIAREIVSLPSSEDIAPVIEALAA